MSREIDWELACPEGYCKRVLDILGKTPENSSTGHAIAEAWGKYAEALTIRHLVLRGMTIREWNWRPPKGKGEIDIITQRGNRIIFVEVKARCGHTEDPYYAITDRKIKDLCRGANIYLKMQKETFEYQFDVAFLRGEYPEYELEYIEDAFMCPLSSLSH